MSDKYIVKSGDTLSKIAKEHHMTVEEIARDNNIGNPDRILPGQKLILHPKAKIKIVDAVAEPIKQLECKVTYNGQTHSCFTDEKGNLPELKTRPNDRVKVEVKRMEGGYKTVAEFLMGKRTKDVVLKSPKIRFDSYTTIDYTRNPKMAPKNDGSLSDNEMQLTKKTTVVYNPQGAPVAKVNSVDIEEARVRAFMRMLRVGEGTIGERGYELLYGGKSFREAPYYKSFSDHPNIHMPFTENQTSSAAGAYQVMGYNWNSKPMKKIRQKYAHVIVDFSPLSQDYFCVALLKHKIFGFKGTLHGIQYNIMKNIMEIKKFYLRLI